MDEKQADQDQVYEDLLDFILMRTLIKDRIKVIEKQARRLAELERPDCDHLGLMAQLDRLLKLLGHVEKLEAASRGKFKRTRPEANQ